MAKEPEHEHDPNRDQRHNAREALRIFGRVLTFRDIAFLLIGGHIGCAIPILLEKWFQ